MARIRSWSTALILLLGCQSAEPVRILELTIQDQLSKSAELRVRLVDDRVVSAAPIVDGVGTVVVPVDQALEFEVTDPVFRTVRPVVTVGWSPVVTGCEAGPVVALPILRPACVTERECLVLTDEAYACLLACLDLHDALNVCLEQQQGVCDTLESKLEGCRAMGGSDCGPLLSEYELECRGEMCPEHVQSLDRCEDTCMDFELRRQAKCQASTLTCEDALRVYRFNDRLAPLGCGGDE